MQSPLRPPVTLPYTAIDQDMTWLPQDRMWHTGIRQTQPPPTMQKSFSQKMPSSALLAAVPMHDVALTSTPSRNIAVANPGQTEKRPPMSANDVDPWMSESSAKRINQESTSFFKPDGINVRNSDVTVMSEYKLHMNSVAWFTSTLYHYIRCNIE